MGLKTKNALPFFKDFLKDHYELKKDNTMYVIKIVEDKQAKPKKK